MIYLLRKPIFGTGAYWRIRRYFMILVALIVRWKRGREERVVATWTAKTGFFNSDGEPEGHFDAHVVSFLIDGNGDRYSRVETTSERHADCHAGVRMVRTDWCVHGDLPRKARRVDNRPRGKLIVFQGGKDGAT